MKSLGSRSLPFLYPEGWTRRPNMKVDIDKLHIYLWKHTDHHGLCRLTLEEVGDRLNLTRPRIKKYYRRMKAEGRIKDFGRRVVIADPGLWAFDRRVLDAVESLPGKRP